jgi:hypothetical protein
LEDLVCGYWVEEKDNVSLYYLPLSWVVLLDKAEGHWKYRINTQRVQERDIEKLPRELASLIRRYKKFSGEKAYAPVDFEKQLCIKFNDSTTHIIPPFIYIIKLVVDLLKLKELGMLQHEGDVTNLLEMFVPSAENEHDNILFSKETIHQYATGLTDLVGDASVVLPTPFKLEVLPTSKSTASERNSVKHGVEIFGSETMIPDLSRADTAGEMKLAIQLAQSKMFTLFDQISSAISLKMKCDGYLGGGYEYEYKLLHMNEFNRHEIQDQLTKNASSGAVDKFEREASMGNTPDILLGQHLLENFVYADMFESLTVLPSSHTQSGDAGRPSNESVGKPLGDAGQQTIDVDGNDPTNRGT